MKKKKTTGFEDWEAYKERIKSPLKKGMSWDKRLALTSLPKKNKTNIPK